MLCGLHAVNAMLQHDFGPPYTQRDLDALCYRLDPPRLLHLNAHKSAWGVGNYDVNVLLCALGERGLEAKWWDARRPARDMPLGSADVVGLLVNSESTEHPWARAILRAAGAGTHWYTLRRVDGQWYDLNSALLEPERIPGTEHLIHRLEGVLAGGGNVIIISRPLPAAADAGAPE